MRKILYSLVIILCFSSKMNAQFICGNPEYEQQLINNNPVAYMENKQALDAFVQKYIAEHGEEAKAGNKYVIPMVFHIIHYYGTENISDAQIKRQVEILNRDYNKLNEDTSQVEYVFKPLIGKMNIEFRLATKDPLGNPTTGIDRIVTVRTNNGADFSKLNSWSRNRYLNIWVVRTIGSSRVAGYAFTPTSAATPGVAPVDGVLILHNYIGDMGTGSAYSSRALTHEIGHCLGLLHPWGPTNEPGVECGDEGIDDTPVTKGFNLSCPDPNTTAIGTCRSDTFRLGTVADTTKEGPFNAAPGMGSRVQYIITAAELAHAKDSGCYINNMTLYIKSHLKKDTIRNLTIKIGHTGRTGFANSTFIDSGLVTVYTPNLVSGNRFGFVTSKTKVLLYNITPVFKWNQKDNVVLEISHDSIYGANYFEVETEAGTGKGLGLLAVDAKDSATGTPISRPVIKFSKTVIENYQNYMDYSYCSRMFTKKQIVYMEAVLNNNIADRSNLSKPSNLVLTGTSDSSVAQLPVPKADFFTSAQNGITAQTFCANTGVSFTDASWRGEVSSWFWEFGADATPSTSTDKNPSVSFSAQGWKTIKLTVTNASGSNTLVKENYVYITDPNAAQYSNGFGEDFESGTLESRGWIVLNPENNESQWSLVETEGSGSSINHCVKLNNYRNLPSDLDVLISPSLDLTSYTPGTAHLRFSFSCASGALDTAYFADVLTVYSSVDCGKNWQIRKRMIKKQLTNAGFYPYAFTTNPYQWTEVSVPLTSNLLTKNTRFRFDFNTNGLGNNIYLDNIYISKFATGVEDIDASSFTADVFPNPASGVASLVINTPEATKTVISIFDITGRKIETLYSGNLAMGSHTMQLNAGKAQLRGVYFINIEGNNQVVRKKVIFF